MIKEVKWKIQRLFRGYSDSDLWDLNSYIVERIRPAFKAFVKHAKKNGMGCPIEELFDKNKRNNCQKWIEVLQKIEKSFDLMHEEETKVSRTLKQQIKDGKSIQEGLELFGKHLQSLWD